MHTKFCVVLMAGLFSFGCSSTDSGDMAYTDTEEAAKNAQAEYGDAEDYFSNAEEYYGAGDYHRALNQFEKLLKVDPSSRPGQLGASYSRYNVGRNLAARGRLADAAISMDAAKKGFEDLWNGELVKDTAIQDDLNWKSCLGLAMTERAIAALQKQNIDRIDRRLPSISDAAESRAQLNEQATFTEKREHNLRNSFSKFRKLVQMENAAPEAMLNLGDLYLIRGNEAAAERAYLDYLAVARNSVERWNKLRADAPQTYKGKNELKRALATMKQKEQSATKKTVDVLVHLAEIKFSRKNWGDSLSYLKDALDLDPERRNLHVPIAECYDKLGNYKEAIDHISIYIQTSPKFEKDTQRAFRLRSELVRKLEGQEGGAASR